MNVLSFVYQKISGSEPYEMQKLLKALEPETQRIHESRSNEYTTPYGFVRLPYDEDMYTYIDHVVAAKKRLQPDVLVLVGIGGSNLGTLAIHEFLHGMMYNIKNPTLQFYCADTIEGRYTQDLLEVIEGLLAQGKKVLINIISKSGTTIETIVNASLLYELIVRYHPHEAAHYIVVTTDKGSPLFDSASSHNFTILEVPTCVGGRYSILSAVGLFPLALLGIDIKALRQGARDALESLMVAQENSWPAISAVILYQYMLKGYTIHDTFIFAPHGFSLGLWYRQLMAESLGKGSTLSGEPVSLSITPTTSIGTTDLHSMAQLYLAGFHNKITTMIAIEGYNNRVIPDNTFSHGTAVQDKTVDNVYQTIMQAIGTIYMQENRPYMLWRIPDNDPYALGQFIYFKMVEIVYLGYLMEVDPFNQPEVELYKQEVRRILA